jgi:hypothetical protein
LKYRSPDLSENVGLYNNLGIKDTDGNGRKEVVFGDNVSLYQFE